MNRVQDAWDRLYMLADVAEKSRSQMASAWAMNNSQSFGGSWLKAYKYAMRTGCYVCLPKGDYSWVR